jgi:hypothetical protein
VYNTLTESEYVTHNKEIWILTSFCYKTHFDQFLLQHRLGVAPAVPRPICTSLHYQLGSALEIIKVLFQPRLTNSAEFIQIQLILESGNPIISSERMFLLGCRHEQKLEPKLHIRDLADLFI